MTDNLPHHCRYELRLTFRFGQHEWRYIAEGRFGAIEFWVRESPKMEGIDKTHYGGVEQHSCSPSSSEAPDHGRCWALSDRACWHDGSASYASEVWIPRWLADPNDHDGIFRSLAREYLERFEPSQEDAPEAPGQAVPQ
jgi:hypothetical protein